MGNWIHPYFQSIHVQIACYMAKFWTNICDCNHWQLVQQAFSRIYHISRISQQDNLRRKVKFLNNINSDDITENCDPLRGKINMDYPESKCGLHSINYISPELREKHVDFTFIQCGIFFSFIRTVLYCLLLEYVWAWVESAHKELQPLLTSTKLNAT